MKQEAGRRRRRCRRLPSAASNECSVSRYYYAGDSVLSGFNFPADDIAVTNDTRPRLVVEETLGYEVSRSYAAYLADSQVSKSCVQSGAAYDDTNNLVTTTYFVTNSIHTGRVSRVVHPDNTLTVYSYAYSNSPAERLTTVISSGAGSGETVTNGTETTTVTDSGDRVLSSSSKDIASGIVFSSVVYTRDGFGRETGSSNVLNGTYVNTTYGCCGPELVVDSDGIQTETTYDELERVFATTRLGVSAFSLYNAQGQVIENIVQASNQTWSTVSSVFDKSGQLLAVTNELGYVTTYAYSTNSSGGRVVTTTYPSNGVFKVETYLRDGRLASVTGTVVSAVCYDYGADSNGLYTVVYQGSTTNATEWVATYSDILGRGYKTVRPGYTNMVYFDSAGRQIRSTDGFTTSLTDYNAKGEAWRSAVDMDGNNTIDVSGTDRISESESGYGTFGGKDVAVQTRRVYPTNSSASAVEIATSKSSADGLKAWSVSFNRTNVSETVLDRANNARTTTTTRPDGTQTVLYYTNNLLYTVVEKDSAGGTVATRTSSYDALLRLASTVEPAASGEQRTTTFKYNASGSVTGVTVTAGSLCQSTYTFFDSMGRRWKTVAPDGGAVTNSYSARGELLQQDGARTYPASYSYTDQGRLSTLSTYRNGLGGSADVTSWLYDSQRGWMTAKVYADSSTNNYQYLANGALQKRIWARGVQTEYLYGPDGALTNVNYSDSTPDVFFTQDRMGRTLEIKDGIGVYSNSFGVYDTLTSVTDARSTGTWGIQYNRDSIGRLTNAAVLSSGVASHSVDYQFGVLGHLDSATANGRSANYNYGPDGLSVTNLNYGGAFVVTKVFDGLNRLIQISNAGTNSLIFSHAYSYNSSNQRTNAVLADGSYWVYEYDQYGQVTSGKRYFSDGIAAGGAQFGYEFDTIGNRTSAVGPDLASAPSSAYTANSLNQYEQRTVPGLISFSGTADSNTVVAVRVNDEVARLANRHGEYFWQTGSVDNAGAMVTVTNTTLARKVGGTNSIIRTETSTNLIARTPEVFLYDRDGNLVCDGTWTNTWDAENRLVASETLPDVPDAMRRRLVYGYDRLGRRARRQTESNFQGSSFSHTNVVEYIWSGWNVVLELKNDGNDSRTNSYVWGLDVCNSTQDSGGVGGLLFANLNGTNCIPAFDGNGNVMALIDLSNGTLVAEYDYGPFGESLKCCGVLAKENPFRWSTKQQDDESDLVYYGRRYYSPRIGRWLSRDPACENTELSLYNAMRNDCVDFFDLLGLITKGSGHHKVPWDIFFGYVSDEAAEVFNSPKGRIFHDAFKSHNNHTVGNVTHPGYSTIVKKYLDEYIGKNCQSARSMTGGQANEFLDFLDKLPDNNAVKKFNNGVRKEIEYIVKHGENSAELIALRGSYRKGIYNKRNILAKMGLGMLTLQALAMIGGMPESAQAMAFEYQEISDDVLDGGGFNANKHWAFLAGTLAEKLSMPSSQALIQAGYIIKGAEEQAAKADQLWKEFSEIPQIEEPSPIVGRMAGYGKVLLLHKDGTIVEFRKVQ